MVIKGNARGDACRLARHLLRTDTNERVELRELRGVVADELDDALREMAAVASGTRCRRPLYHASLNARAEEIFTEAQQREAIHRLEAALGFSGQACAVVAHVKGGRAHLHVVWSRIKLDTMTAIHDGHNYRKHERVARELERDFGHARVQGAHIEREGVPRPRRTPRHAEMQQAERSGLAPQAATELVTALWRATDSGRAFRAALEAQGWTLARGDRRDFVLIDPHGETHSLARRVADAKAAAVRQHMADLDPASLPDAKAAKAAQEARQAALAVPPLPSPPPAAIPLPEPPPEPPERARD